MDFEKIDIYHLTYNLPLEWIEERCKFISGQMRHYYHPVNFFVMGPETYNRIYQNHVHREGYEKKIYGC